MALPLKSGADLYNQQAIRMRLHNLGADPSEVGMGLIYFNTNTDTQGSNHSLHPCVYNGTSFKALAYVDDVANNAEFKALQDDVKLLKGDVDTDTLINNLKDLEEFLKGYDESDKLQSLLDGKLDKSGGTISGLLTIQDSNPRITFKTSATTTIASLGIFSNKLTMYHNGDAKYYDIYHTGNFNPADYLPLSGGVLTGNIAWQRDVNGNDIADWNAEASKFGIGIISAGGASTGVPTGYATALNVRGRYGFQLASEGGNYDNFFIRNASTIRPWVKLIHSGNIASQNVNSALMLDGKSLTRFIYNELGESETGTTDTGAGGYESLTRTQFFRDNAISSIGLLVYHSSASTYGFALYNYSYETANLKFRVKSAGAWGIEKTIAFTDSNVASATKLQTARTIWGQSFDGTGNVSGNLSLGNGGILGGASSVNMLHYDTSNTLYLGYGMSGVGGSVICGNGIAMRYGSSRDMGFLLNSSGNVTIGASDLAGTSRKLFVSGGSAFFVNTQSNITTTDQLDRTKTFTISATNNDTYSYGLHVWIDPSGRSNLQSSYAGLAANKSTYPIVLNPLGGNILIGTTTDAGYKLHVNGTARIADAVKLGHTLSVGGNTTINGDLHVTGNIVADKEVSAGGAGEEGGSSSGGSGAFDTTTLTKGQSSYNVAHNLGTDNVIICIYEKSTSGTWEMILTDVEITDANNIKVTFGSATSVDHKVVIMGAVA